MSYNPHVEYSISSRETIKSTLKKMTESNRKLLLLVDDGIYRGLVSIGDIQRALIANRGLETPVIEIIRDVITVARTGEDEEAIKLLMFQHRIELMPILDEDGSLVRVIEWKDVFNESLEAHRDRIDVPVVIMAGGEGTRLKPLTNVIPKALVPVYEKPIIQEIVDSFHRQGTTRFYFTVNYKKELIKGFFSTLGTLPYAIEYVEEGEFRGTAGSLGLLRGKIDETFIVTNCDVVVEQDYSEILKFHKHNGNEITVVSALKIVTIPYGVLHTGENGRLKAIEEKPDFSYQANAGFYVLESHLLREIPDAGIFHITHLIQRVLDRNGTVGVFPVNEDSWWDMGEWAEYSKMQKHMMAMSGAGK